MRFKYEVIVEVERVQGKFASRDEIDEAIVEALESANFDTFTGENDGEYEVIDWSVSHG